MIIMNLSFKRIFAYFIDVIIVTFISSALTYATFLNPKQDDYTKYTEEYNKAVEKFYDDQNVDDFSKTVNDLSYNLNKSGYVYLIGDIVIAFLYFSVFAYFTNGQTLGKKIMKIKVVDYKTNDNPKIYQYLLRTFLLNGVILNLGTLVLINFSSKTYYQIYPWLANFDTILLLVIILTALFTKEKRGIHDYAAHTKVIDLKNNIIVKEEE